nr:U32 family peptidase [uncultured Acetatifactor sp.]
MSHHIKTELLAPAGNAEGFYGAMHAGADAVYLAGSRFGARAYAENFTTQELVRCIRYAHLLGRKVYLTVNTLLKEDEFAGLDEYLYPFCEAGLDAVIVQDLGVLRFIREHFPNCKLHASTQMTLCGSWGASLLQSMGVSRIVPARELSLKELIVLKQNTGLEIEAFIHGAMCYCYSGQCLFSSILGGRSGNRGRCAQPCRLPYSVIADGVKSKNCYPLSLKDMCTIEHIPRLIEARIDSFKIEGRMKRPEYAAGATALYRKYIDRYYELREKRGPEAAEVYRVEKTDWKCLTSLYIRSSVQDGYYFKHNGRDMITLDSPAYSGNDEAVLSEIRDRHLAEPLKLPVRMKAVFQTGRPAELTMLWKEVSVTVRSDVVQRAQHHPVTEENIRKQLIRLGDSVFHAETLEMDISQDCFYPLKEINALRRRAVAELEERILLENGYGKADVCRKEDLSENEVFRNRKSVRHPEKDSHEKGFVFAVRTIPQLETVAEETGKGMANLPVRLYVDSDLLVQEWEKVCRLCGSVSFSGGIYAALPYVIRESDRNYLTELYEKVQKSRLFCGFLIRSMDGLGFAMQTEKALPCRGDAGLYVWNRSALQEIGNMLEGFCLPYELRASEQKTLLNGLSDRLPCEKIIYGRIPMMITANCLLKTTDRCRNHRAGQNEATLERQRPQTSEQLVLKDRRNKDFPVLVNCRHCMNIIYNSVPLSLYRELSGWREWVDLRMDFTLESPKEVRRLITSLRNNMPFPEAEYTTGHEKRGVE